MRNFKLTLSYDGTDFRGWQSQPDQRTVQQTLEEAIASLVQERVRVNASGRTDTGVHAVAQVVNFHTASALPLFKIKRGINSYLPEDVLVTSAEEVADTFDANRDVVSKHYRYVLHDGESHDLFLRRYSYHVRYKLDVAAMNQASACLLGTHDFRCFETEWPNRASSVRTILRAACSRFGDWVWFDIEADGFLYNMVRAIVGTLLNIGRGFWPESYLPELLENGDRTTAGPNAPAKGLFLMRVRYP